jgi:ParB family transcriptional regulator, chromosome partitioning protein
MKRDQRAGALPGDDRQDFVLPLSSLFRDPLNVRQQGGVNIGELAALIESQGLLQSLTVRAEVKGRKKSGRHGVVAGGRRLEALELLASQRKIAEDHPVRCRLVPTDHAIAVSLAENSGREPLHGADLFDAYQRLHDQGQSVAQIAVAFGVRPITVERRLRLAKVSPKLLGLYREGGIDYEALSALTLTDDHALQESVWASLPNWQRTKDGVRRVLLEQDMPAHHRLARFVGLAAYEAAGGQVRRDLFSEDSDTSTLTNPALVHALARDALTVQAEALAGPGVAWMEARVDYSPHDRQGLTLCRMVRRPATAEEESRMTHIEGRMTEIEARLDALDDFVVADHDESGKEVAPEPPAEDARAEDLEGIYDALQEEHEALRASLLVPDERDAGIAGAVVYIDANGAPAVARGLVRLQDRVGAASGARANRAAECNDPDGDAHPTAAPAPTRPVFSERLMNQLTAHRTAALRAMVADEPRVALRILAYQLASQVFYEASQWRHDRPVEIRLAATVLTNLAPDLGDSLAQQQLERIGNRLGDEVPGEPDRLLPWVLAVDDHQVLELLAYCTACSLNAVHGAPQPTPTTDALAHAVELDMADWWQPTSAGYFNAVSKDKVLQAVKEGGALADAGAVASMKKAEMAATAERVLHDKRWLPSPLQLPAG